MTDETPEAAEADAVDQRTDAVPATAPASDNTPDVPLEADPADTAEQSREIAADQDDDYR
jgi:hypothetical protein